MILADVYQGKRVLITGHTGFKGSWLSEWLLGLGAEVTGFALPPATTPALFDQLGLAARSTHLCGDIRDPAAVLTAVTGAQPDFIFHLAAQSLVRRSYAEPVETYATNVMGTVNVLEAVRLARRQCVVVAVTTDKCYENKEWVNGYREGDSLGGHDPYSSSKGAAELVIAAYRTSYFALAGSAVRVASARAGNVLGGGDWALDRIVPDSIRSLSRGEAICVRNKSSIRPWQHVMEPLSGYLWLGARLEQASANSALASAYNFGPELSSNRPVADLVEEILKHWPGRWEDRSDPRALHEAKLLNLAIDKAFHILQWRPIWSFETAIMKTVEWYRESAALGVEASRDITRRQISDYVADARAARLDWSL